MYGYASDKDITPQQILQKISQEEIFEFILGLPFNIAERYISPLRDEDTQPGCRFDLLEDGTIHFIDFGDKVKTHNTCFGLVMRYYKTNLRNAVQIIISHFQLSDEFNDYAPPDRIFNVRESNKPNTPATINYDKIDYSKRDKLHWSQFLITTDQLASDNVFSTNKFFIIREGKKKVVDVYGPCYAMDFISRVKLYQPYSEKYKFITNCDENNIGNFDNLPPIGDYLIVAKSYKDHRIMRNFLLRLHVIWFQNEGCVPAMEILVGLSKRFMTIIFFYDNDKAGIEAAIKMCNICNSIRQGWAVMVHLPIRTDKTWVYKDPGEFIKKEGQHDLIKIFKEILLCQNIRL